MTTRILHLPIEGHLPSLGGATAWLNSPPLTADGLRGRPVLVQFWTYTCINWLRTLPWIRAWAQRYRDDGLTVIGVHTPEFAFEHDLDNVRRATEQMRIGYPVAVDNDYRVWDAFANHYWPALYLVDAEGRVRHHHFGEGDYEFSEVVIRRLLAGSGIGPDGMDDDGADRLDPGVAVVEAEGAEVPADWDDLGSGENYLGAERTENFASPGGVVPGVPHQYSAPARLRLNQWALSGTWTIGEGSARLDEGSGCLTCRFHARDVHLVMGPSSPGRAVPFRVRIDGRSPGAAHGSDVDEQGNGTLTEQRLHQLIRQPKPIADREFEIEFLDAGAETLAFTFG